MADGNRISLLPPTLAPDTEFEIPASKDGVTNKLTVAQILDLAASAGYLKADGSVEVTGAQTFNNKVKLARNLQFNRSADTESNGIEFTVADLANWLLFTPTDGSGDFVIQSRNYDTDGSLRNGIVRLDWANGVCVFLDTPTVNSNVILHRGNVFESRNSGSAGAYTNTTQRTWSEAHVKDAIETLGGFTFLASQAASSGTTVDFSSLPSDVNIIHIGFRQVGLSGSGNLLVQIGDAGGFETSGYISAAASDGGGGSDFISSTNGFGIRLADSSRAFIGRMTLVRVSGNLWVSDHIGRCDTTRQNSGGGEKELSAELTQVRVTTSAGNFDDADGEIVLAYQ